MSHLDLHKRARQFPHWKSGISGRSRREQAFQSQGEFGVRVLSRASLSIQKGLSTSRCHAHTARCRMFQTANLAAASRFRRRNNILISADLSLLIADEICGRRLIRVSGSDRYMVGYEDDGMPRLGFCLIKDLPRRSLLGCEHVNLC